MPKFTYDGPMPADQQTRPNGGKPSILRQVLEALAVHFGWDNWSHYHKNNYAHAVQLKQEVYELPHSEKLVILSNIQKQKNEKS